MGGGRIKIGEWFLRQLFQVREILVRQVGDTTCHYQKRRHQGRGTKVFQMELTHEVPSFGLCAWILTINSNPELFDSSIPDYATR
jgi:hypothetical protein